MPLLCLSSVLSAQSIPCDGRLMIINGYGNANVYPIVIDRENGVSGVGQPIVERETPQQRWNPEAYGYRWKDSTFYGAILFGGYTSIANIFSLSKDGTISFTVDTFPSIEDGFVLEAGCISNDQQHFLLLEDRRLLPMQGGGYNLTLPNLLHKIDLETDHYTIEETLLVQGIAESDTIGIISTDIAMDPGSGLCFAFDRFTSKMVTIDLETGLLDNVSYPPIDFRPYGGIMPNGLFFDAFNRLYGIAHDMNHHYEGSYLYEFDKSNGTIAHAYPFTPPSDTCKIYDGCSCPMTVAIEKALGQEELRPCQTTEAVIKIAFMNQAVLANPASLRDSFPIGVEIQEVIYNPYGGQITGIGTNMLDIQGLQPKFGVDSIVVRLYVAEQMPGGAYTCQASLYDINLSEMGDSRTSIYSDYLPSPAYNDATPFSVTPFEDLEPQLAFQKCEGLPVVLRLFENTNGLSFLWEGGFTADTLSVSVSGLYDVSVNTGCEELNYTIEVADNILQVNLGPDQQLHFGEVLTVMPDLQNSSPISSYLWSSTDTAALSCLTCPVAEVLPIQTTATLSLLVTDENGCTVEDKMDITVERPVYAPTAFSPNGDGNNDYSTLLTPIDVELIYFRVFDRWGGLLWEQKNGITNGTNYSWDGRSPNGEQVPPGLYLWSARLEYPDGFTQELSGEVSLMR